MATTTANSTTVPLETSTTIGNTSSIAKALSDPPVTAPSSDDSAVLYGAIGGGVAGFVLLAVLVAIIVCCIVRRKNAGDNNNNNSADAGKAMGSIAGNSDYRSARISERNAEDDGGNYSGFPQDESRPPVDKNYTRAPTRNYLPVSTVDGDVHAPVVTPYAPSSSLSSDEAVPTGKPQLYVSLPNEDQAAQEEVVDRQYQALPRDAGTMSSHPGASEAPNYRDYF